MLRRALLGPLARLRCASLRFASDLARVTRPTPSRLRKAEPTAVQRPRNGDVADASQGEKVLRSHHTIDEVDRGLARDLRKMDNAQDVLQHFAENRGEYDLVNLSTALHRVSVLSDAVKPWKREPLPRDIVNALVNDSIERLREYVSAFHQRTLDERAAAAAAVVADTSVTLHRSHAPSSAALSAVSTRAIASMTWGLAKLGRAPPPVLDEVSLALAERVSDMTPADMAQVWTGGARRRIGRVLYTCVSLCKAARFTTVDVPSAD
jgi:hypothetical protein